MEDPRPSSPGGRCPQRANVIALPMPRRRQVGSVLTKKICAYSPKTWLAAVACATPSPSTAANTEAEGGSPPRNPATSSGEPVIAGPTRLRRWRRRAARRSRAGPKLEAVRKRRIGRRLDVGQDHRELGSDRLPAGLAAQNSLHRAASSNAMTTAQWASAASATSSSYAESSVTRRRTWATPRRPASFRTTGRSSSQRPRATNAAA